MDIHSLGHVDNQLYVGIVVIIRATWHLHILICHSDVVCVGLQIFGCRHDSELNRPLIAESLVRPFPDGSDLLDGRNSIVRNQYLHSHVSMAPSPFLAVC